MPAAWGLWNATSYDGAKIKFAKILREIARKILGLRAPCCGATRALLSLQIIYTHIYRSHAHASLSRKLEAKERVDSDSGYHQRPAGGGD